jgi:hypothetical protein
MESLLLAVAGLAIVIAAAGFSLVHLRGHGAAFTTSSRHAHRDSDIHALRAESEAEMEENDIDNMLDAIAERRRAHGRPDVGDELARALLRDAREE